MQEDSVKPVAIVISDLHLTLVAPACRADKDWMEVQANYLKQVKIMAGKLPVLCAGDIFDRWNPPNELVNFALRHLPTGMLAVPGQHDLPNHRIDQMNRSGYGVLKEAGKIRDVSDSAVGPFMCDGWRLIVYGFGWNQPITPPSGDWKRPFLKIALIHCYCWTEGHSFPGAAIECRSSSYAKPLKGYDIALFGDNHKGFLRVLKTNTVLLNVGGFIRRKSDEIDYIPSVGVIYSDGSVKRRKLDTSGDVFHDKPKEKEEAALDMRQFLAGLEGLGEHGLNFREAVENHLRQDDIKEETKKIIWQALDDAKR